MRLVLVLLAILWAVPALAGEREQCGFAQHNAAVATQQANTVQLETAEGVVTVEGVDIASTGVATEEILNA